MQRIIHNFPIHSNPESVYKAISTIEGLNGWWSDTIGGSTAVNEVIDFKFIEVFNPQMKVLASEPGKEVKWECIDGHEPWLGNIITFLITAQADGSQLHFTHEYTSPIAEEDYGYYNFNWGYYLNSLKDYCETGEGSPHRKND